MALKSSGITRPADLKGKKVGYPGIEWDELMLAAMLEADGLTLDDVELHDVGYALSQCSPPEPWTPSSAHTGHTNRSSSKTWDSPSRSSTPKTGAYPRYYEMMLITSDQMIEENPTSSDASSTLHQRLEYVAETDNGASTS